MMITIMGIISLMVLSNTNDDNEGSGEHMMREVE